MNWTCIICDLRAEESSADLVEVMRAQDWGMRIVRVRSEEDFRRAADAGGCAAMVLIAPKFDAQCAAMLGLMRDRVGLIPDFVMMACEEPGPKEMMGLFEFGVEQLCLMDEWPAHGKTMVESAMSTLEDESSSEFKALEMGRAILVADQTVILEKVDGLRSEAEYNFVAAYAEGRALEASGKTDAAIASFERVNQMNRLFRPSKSSLGENLLVAGRADEAVKVFEELEKANPTESSRKGMLASAYLEAGQPEKAAELLKKAKSLGVESDSRILEAEALIHLKAGKVKEAFAAMDGMSDVGPFFAGKLNDIGIKLSKLGKGKSALALYTKAHKIVRKELRFKISLNAALACHRLNDNELALKFIQRTRKEYGGTFDKLEKIELAIRQSLRKRAG